jgi:hypothetical protein
MYQDNMNILRDAAQLQMQLRLYDQLVQTRHTLLALRPTMRLSWVALAVAYQMSGDLEKADKVLVNYKSMLKASTFVQHIVSHEVKINLQFRMSQTMIMSTRSCCYITCTLWRTLGSMMRSLQRWMYTRSSVRFLIVQRLSSTGVSLWPKQVFIARALTLNKLVILANPIGSQKLRMNGRH